MATEEKSIEISYKANIKELIAQLKKIPGITAEEAKKMATALDRQLKQAEKASKKSAAATQKAMKQTAKLARVGDKALRDIGDSAQRAEKRLENVADASGDIDRGFSSVGLALREVNPKLAEAADGLADTFAVVEGLTMSFKALNPFVVAGAVAIGALTLGYQSHKKELEKVKQITLEYRDAQKALNDSQKAQADNLLEGASTITDLREELGLLTGQISEYDYAVGMAQRQAFQGLQDNIEAQDQLIKGKGKEIDLLGRLYLAARDLSRNEVALSDQQKEQLRTLQLQTKAVSNKLDLSKRDEDTMQAFLDMQKEARAQEAEMKKNRLGLVKMQKAAVELAGQIADYQFEQAQEGERVAKSEEAREKALAKSVEEAERLAQIQEDIARFKEKQEQSELAIEKAQERLANKMAQIMADDIGKINLKYDTEIERLQELAKEAETTAGVQEAIDQLEIERLQEIKEIRDKNHEEKMKQIQEETFAVANQFSAFMGASADFIEARNEGNQEAALKAFRLRQAEGIANVAISTAEGIAKAMGYGPIAGPIMAGLIAGTGVAQAGAIMAQQPPQFHMGGIAPDETRATLLRGEAVLDRATVRRIGGSQGVKQLQQGNNNQEQLVVIQPFKHFGRFTREIGYRPPKRTGTRGY